ncbi:hypothetical protein LBW89_11550 [Paenibacillus sp. alder61]|uniref:Uncharacterized protein n=1 Tax=Paenibacillus faecis TaxID=862114 RepID=A0A5D0CS27_9BACL|nr:MULTISPECIES: hypothetical protein [Paenibacillus]MCA1293650.1 hypothetical protein [Paenibacillus sp. alder61]TYA12761.1 hypothetical protein FRY98_08605 [Paenibacillus faecis]
MYALLPAGLLIVYLVCLHTVFSKKITRRHQGKHEYGMGVLFVLVMNWIYTFLNAVPFGFFAFSAIFGKPPMILAGSLLFLVLTLCQHALATYYKTYAGYVVWAYLLFLGGVGCYILSLYAA